MKRRSVSRRGDAEPFSSLGGRFDPEEDEVLTPRFAREHDRLAETHGVNAAESADQPRSLVELDYNGGVRHIGHPALIDREVRRDPRVHGPATGRRDVGIARRAAAGQ